MRFTRSKAHNSRSPLSSAGSAESSKGQFSKLLNRGKEIMRGGVLDALPPKLPALSVEAPNPATAPTRQKIVNNGGYDDTRVVRDGGAFPRATVEPPNASRATHVPTVRTTRQVADATVNSPWYSTSPITERQRFEESRASFNASKNTENPAMPPQSTMAGGEKLGRTKTQPYVRRMHMEHTAAVPTKKQVPVQGTTMTGGTRHTTGNALTHDKENSTNAEKFVPNDGPGSSSRTNGASTSAKAGTSTNTAPLMTIDTLKDVRRTFIIRADEFDKSRVSLSARIGNAMVHRTLVNAKRTSFIENVGEILEEFACRDGEEFLKAFGSTEKKVDVEDAPMVNATGKGKVTAEQRAALGLLVSQGIKIRDFQWPVDDPRHLGQEPSEGNPEFRNLVLGNALKKAEEAAKLPGTERMEFGELGLSGAQTKAGPSTSTSTWSRNINVPTRAAPEPIPARNLNHARPRTPVFSPPTDPRTPAGPLSRIPTLEGVAELCPPVSLSLMPVFTAPPPPPVPSSSSNNSARLTIHRAAVAVDETHEREVEMEQTETETVSDASSWTTYSNTPPIAGPSRKRTVGCDEDDDGWTTSEYEASPKRTVINYQPEEKNRKRKERAHYDDDMVSSSAIDEQPPVKRLKYSNGPYDAQGRLEHTVPAPLAVSSIPQDLAAPRGAGRGDGQSLARLYGKKWPPSRSTRRISDLEATSSISALGRSAVDVTGSIGRRLYAFQGGDSLMDGETSASASVGTLSVQS